MNGKKIEIQTGDGIADAYFSRPANNAAVPGVVWFMDAFGLRPTAYEMVDRLAAKGYAVLAPNVLYRLGPIGPFDPATVFAGPGPQQDALMKAVSSLDEASASRDVSAYFEFLESQPNVAPKKFGCVGYCMGGGLAVGAACMHPERVAVAASFHGGRFVVEPASPEIIAAKARASIYIGVAEIDRRHNAEVSAKLEDALTRAGVRHAIELYAGVAHGFAVPDVPSYDRAAAERHWERLFAFFGEAFASNAS